VSSSTNRSVSERLYEYSAVLEQQEANPFRVKAYQRAAATVEGLDEDIGEIYERGGTESLVALPNIGRGIASAIAELLQTDCGYRTEAWREEIEKRNGEFAPAPYLEALRGFERHWVGESPDRIVEVVHLNRNATPEETARDRVRDGDPDFIVTLGTPATRAALRVAAAKHFPSDVVPGLILGVATAGLVHTIKF